MWTLPLSSCLWASATRWTSSWACSLTSKLYKIILTQQSESLLYFCAGETQYCLLLLKLKCCRSKMAWSTNISHFPHKNIMSLILLFSVLLHDIFGIPNNLENQIIIHYKLFAANKYGIFSWYVSNWNTACFKTILTATMKRVQSVRNYETATNLQVPQLSLTVSKHDSLAKFEVEISLLLKGHESGKEETTV